MDPYGLATGAAFVLLGAGVIVFRWELTDLDSGTGAEGEVHHRGMEVGRAGPYVFGGLLSIVFGLLLLLGSL